jgi:DNA-binding transcriptional MerR regulator
MPYKELSPSDLKIYYTIGEVADKFNVNQSLIRFWEKEFDILKPKKNKKGNRLFSKDDVENIRTIYQLVKVNGYTLDGAKKYLKSKSLNNSRNPDLHQTLLNIKDFLTDLKNSLDN